MCESGRSPTVWPLARVIVRSTARPTHRAFTRRSVSALTACGACEPVKPRTVAPPPRRCRSARYRHAAGIVYVAGICEKCTLLDAFNPAIRVCVIPQTHRYIRPLLNSSIIFIFFPLPSVGVGFPLGARRFSDAEFFLFQLQCAWWFGINLQVVLLCRIVLRG